jgi:hypothetical protein
VLKTALPVVLLAALGLAARPSWSQVRIGPEFRVNTHTTFWQERPRVAAGADGTFTVVWQGDGPGDSFGVFARRYDASGAALGSDFRVNAYTTGFQRFASVASDVTGRLVVAWRSDTPDLSDYEIIARQYDASGVGGSEFKVNSYTPGRQSLPSAALAGNGAFVVAWTSYTLQDGSGSAVVGQRYDASGAPQFGEFRINSYTPGYQFGARVASDSTGNFVVVWMGQYLGGNERGVFGQRYDASGTPQGGEFQVNAPGSPYNADAAVASDAVGNFIVAWTSRGNSGVNGILARRYNGSGAPLGSAFQVNSYVTGYEARPDVASDAAGNFAVVWTDFSQNDGSKTAVFGRSYDAAGTPQGGEFLVNAHTTSYQSSPSVSMGAGGRFVVVWTSLYQDGDGLGVFGQQFAPDVIFKDGFESGGLSAWSASDTDGGLLYVWTGIDSGWGAWGDVGQSAGIYVQDDTPAAEDRYRVRFYFEPMGFDPGEAEAHRRARLFIAFEGNPNRRLAAIVLRRLAGVYGLMGRVRRDDNSQHDTGFLPLGEGPHYVELDWKRSSGPDTNDGTFEMWIDGTSVHSAAGLDNSAGAVDFVRLGALSVKSGANGTIRWDEFESRRATYIGR